METVLYILDLISHAFLHAAEHTLPLLPFLFLTYLLMEFLEHKGGDKAERLIKKAGNAGPLVGGILGALPQCGFAAAAASLYAARILSLGTLYAVFLSSSDEMLAVMLASGVSPLRILKILGVKVAVGILLGFLTDLFLRFVLRRPLITEADTDLCEAEGCHCEDGIFRSALYHTLKVFLFVILVSFSLNILIELLGEDTLAAFLSALPFVGPLVAALVGLIPNCAASVVITQLYLTGTISAGTMLAGLLTGSGVGILILYRTNKSLRENLVFTAVLYTFGAVAGILLDLLNIGALLL